MNETQSEQQPRLCPNCHVERVWPADQDAHCMSDAEWETYIDGLIEAHKQGRCNTTTCVQCLEPGDPLERWLS